jgi:hypothetical protein
MAKENQRTNDRRSARLVCLTPSCGTAPRAPLCNTNKHTNMKNTPTEKRAAIASSDFLAIMEDELANTVAAYESLLDQCRKLADSMGYCDDHVIGKVMPKTAADRTNTGRISEWFENTKGAAVEHMLQLEAAREQDRERERLLVSLNLTPEQMAILGLANA